jgi:precorrin-2 dehydrogenase / sirohydrochlorin ferrochelatase
LFMDLKGKSCCVIGGGGVAERKVRALLECFAKVTVISPRLTTGLRKLWLDKKITLRNNVYSGNIPRGVFLAIAATDSRLTNARISSLCREKGILVNVVDVPEESDFIVPSFVKKGGLIIAISTSGQAPCLAKKIRQDLTRNFLGRYAGILKEVAPARRTFKERGGRISLRKALLNKLVSSKFSRKAGLR